MQRHREGGFTFPEITTVLVIVALMLMCAMPAFNTMRRRAAVRTAAAELRAIFHLVRSRALARSSNSGIKFLQDGAVWKYAIYDDGDQDGVRNDDIKSGVDRVFRGPQTLWQQPHLVAIALPDFAIKDPDGDVMPPFASPVQFNKSTICSFSHVGEATPGTIYMTDRSGEIYAVRVYGATAKIRVVRYDRGTSRWIGR